MTTFTPVSGGRRSSNSSSSVIGPRVLMSWGQRHSSVPSGSSPSASGTKEPWPEYWMMMLSPFPAPVTSDWMAFRMALPVAALFSIFCTLKPRFSSTEAQSLESFTQPSRSLSVPG